MGHLGAFCRANSSSGVCGTETQVQALEDATLVPVQLTGYLLVLYAVADRVTVRTRSRVAAAQPLLYQRLHLFVSELVS
jgi:hypothetical protein